MLFTDAITWNGKHSYNDMGLAIRTPKGDIPKIKKIRQTVPYMKGEYDFTFANGEPGYNARNIEIEFIYEGEDPDELYDKREAVCDWIMSAQGGTLRFDSIKDGYFKDVYATIKEYNNRLGRNKASITVEFSCYPLKISDFTRPAYYNATGTLTAQTYTLTLDKCIPSFTTTSACQIYFSGVYYTIPANSKRYQITDIQFIRGTNNFSIMGSGELTVECIKESL